MLAKILCIFLSFGMLAHAAAMRKVIGSWTAPAPLFSAFWFVVTFFPLIIVPGAPANPLAILYLLVACLVFSIGAFGFNWRTAFAAAALKPKVNLYGSAVMRLILAGSTGVCLACLVLNSVLQGISIGQIFANFGDSAAQYAEARYGGNIVINIYIQLVTALSYISAATGGLVFGHARSNLDRAYLLAVAFIAPLLVMLTQSAKGMLFLSIALFYAGYMVSRIQMGEYSLIPKGALAKLLPLAAGLVFLVMVSFVTRGFMDTANNQAVIDGLLRYAATYTSVHLYGFSDWFTWYIGGQSQLLYDATGIGAGFWTFMAVFRVLGDERYVPLGTYAEYYRYGWILRGNLYTQYRGLITDFTLLGSLFAMAVSGAIGHFFYRRLLTESHPVLSAAVIIFMVGAIYQSFLISTFMFASIYVSFVGLAVLLFINAGDYLVRSGAMRVAPR